MTKHQISPEQWCYLQTWDEIKLYYPLGWGRRVWEETQGQLLHYIRGFILTPITFNLLNTGELGFVPAVWKIIDNEIKWRPACVSGGIVENVTAQGWWEIIAGHNNSCRENCSGLLYGHNNCNLVRHCKVSQITWAQTFSLGTWTHTHTHTHKKLMWRHTSSIPSFCLTWDRNSTSIPSILTPVTTEHPLHGWSYISSLTQTLWNWTCWPLLLLTLLSCFISLLWKVCRGALWVNCCLLLHHRWCGIISQFVRHLILTLWHVEPFFSIFRLPCKVNGKLGDQPARYFQLCLSKSFLLLPAD